MNYSSSISTDQVLRRLEIGLEKRNAEAVEAALREVIKLRVPAWSIGRAEKDGKLLFTSFNCQDGNYIPILTSPDQYSPKCGASLIALKDVAQILDGLYINSSPPKGVWINPFRGGFAMDEWKIGELIKDVRKNTWGVGIPARYSPCDHMTRRDLADFASEVLWNNVLEPQGFSIHNMIPMGGTLFRLVGYDRNKQSVVIIVAVDIAPVKPQLPDGAEQDLRESAHRHGYQKCYYASVSFGSTDGQRFEKSLALRGDSYYCSFPGLREIPL